MFTIILVSVLILLAGGAEALDNPIGSATSPPSSSGSHLFRKPNPLANGNNDVVTGNVGGGKHFRGNVPYRSGREFGAPIGSSSLESFMRRSAGGYDFDQSTGGGLRSYHYPSRSVSRIKPGSSRIWRPSSGGITGNRINDQIRLERVGQRRGLSISDVPIEKPSLSKPLVEGPSEMGVKGTREVLSYPLGRPLKVQKRGESSAYMGELQKELQRLNRQAEMLKQDLSTGKSESEQETLLQDFELDQKESAEQEQGQQRDNVELEESEDELGVYEQIRKQIDALRKNIQEVEQGEKFGYKEESEQIKEDSEEVSAGSQSKETQAEVSSERPFMSARARVILGDYKDFESYKAGKFKDNMQKGGAYMKVGKYYLAAEAYTTALIYKPGDALANGGKAKALFAAGEYMSSALFLSRALEDSADYVQVEEDMAELVGGRDTLDKRISDLQSCIDYSDSCELKFLLGYIYYHMNRFKEAEELINEASADIPESKAVLAIKKAIDESGSGG